MKHDFHQGLKRTFFWRSMLMAVLLAGSTGGVIADPTLVDLSKFNVVQYEFNDQPNANWILSNGNHTATQTVNADASYLRSDFLLTDTSIDGTWRVNTTNDDDFMGFVFGEQDPNHYYLFDWKKATQNDATYGNAQVGMTLKIVSRSSGSITEFDVWPTTGGANVTELLHNSIPWVSSTDYQFHLEFHPGTFTVAVNQGATVLQTWTVQDSTYTSGHFGFYNDSQDQVVYDAFTQTAVPEPATGVMCGVGAVALLVRRRRRGRE